MEKIKKGDIVARKSHNLDILFSVVYQTNKYTYILDDISKFLGVHFMYKSIRQEYEKKYNAETEATPAE